MFLSGFSNGFLDSEFGAGIDFEVEAESWMAYFRHSPFWCMPKFGTALSDIPDEPQGLIYKKKTENTGLFCLLFQSNINAFSAEMKKAA